MEIIKRKSRRVKDTVPITGLELLQRQHRKERRRKEKQTNTLTREYHLQAPTQTLVQKKTDHNPILINNPTVTHRTGTRPMLRRGRKTKSIVPDTKQTNQTLTQGELTIKRREDNDKDVDKVYFRQTAVINNSITKCIDIITSMIDGKICPIHTVSTLEAVLNHLHGVNLYIKRYDAVFYENMYYYSGTCWSNHPQVDDETEQQCEDDIIHLPRLGKCCDHMHIVLHMVQTLLGEPIYNAYMERKCTALVKLFTDIRLLCVEYDQIYYDNLFHYIEIMKSSSEMMTQLVLENESNGASTQVIRPCSTIISKTVKK